MIENDCKEFHKFSRYNFIKEKICSNNEYLLGASDKIRFVTCQLTISQSCIDVVAISQERIHDVD